MTCKHNADREDQENPKSKINLKNILNKIRVSISSEKNKRKNFKIKDLFLLGRQNPRQKIKRNGMNISMGIKVILFEENVSQDDSLILDVEVSASNLSSKFYFFKYSMRS